MTPEHATLNGVRWCFLMCGECKGTGYRDGWYPGIEGTRRECPTCQGFGMQRFQQAAISTATTESDL